MPPGRSADRPKAEGLSRSVSDGVATLTLSRPPRNLLVPELMDGLREELVALDLDEDVSAVVLTGTGEFFCGGLDIATMREAEGGATVYATAAIELLRVFPRLGTLVVAAVNGDALALGYALVCSSDLAIAVEEAQVGSFEVSVGVWPMTAQVPALHRLAPRHALENIITGRPFTAERAREVGLVNAVVPAAELDSTVTDFVSAASRAGDALGPGRRSFYRLLDMSYDEALDQALEDFKRLFG
jgi:methylglutaconyl-CoA hydratase